MRIAATSSFAAAVFAVCALPFASACSGSGSNLRGADAPPQPGVMIDRVGRAAVSTGTIGTFMPPSQMDDRNALKDDYNSNDDPSTWASEYTAAIAGSIAILDGLDEVCGNQLGYELGGEGTGYEFLASVLADDRLWVNTSSSTCGQYLAVEADATGAIPNSDCGGRTPNYDVIDVTYSVLVLGNVTGVGDGVDADEETHSETAFPFFAQ